MVEYHYEPDDVEALLARTVRCEEKHDDGIDGYGRVCLPAREDPIAVFFSVSRPRISDTEYARRIVKYARCSHAVIIYAMVILHKMAQHDTRLKINSFNMNRLLITAVMISAKLLEDQYFSNQYYSAVGGIPSVQEMNTLEIQMLKILQYQFFFPEALVFKYYHHKIKEWKIDEE